MDVYPKLRSLWLDKLLAEKNLHLAFQVSLIFKGLFALLETIGGIAAYWVSQRALLNLVHAITQTELAEDPRDLVANYLVHLAQNMSISAQHFTAFF